MEGIICVYYHCPSNGWLARGNQGQWTFCLLFLDGIQSVSDIHDTTMKPVNQRDKTSELELVPVQECEIRITVPSVNPNLVQQNSHSMIKNYFIILAKGKPSKIPRKLTDQLPVKSHYPQTKILCNSWVFLDFSEYIWSK